MTDQFAPGGDGTTESTDELRAPLTTTTSIRPAATVLVAAVVMLTVFILVNFITDQATTSTPTTVVVIGGLNVDHHSSALRGCRFVDLPPDNIVGALIVPVGTSSVGPIEVLNGSSGSYDCSAKLRAPHVQGKILGFYLHQLEGIGWTRFSTGPAAHTGGEQYLFNKGGNDTFPWILGVTIDAHSAASTTWTVRLYQDDGIT